MLGLDAWGGSRVGVGLAVLLLVLAGCDSGTERGQVSTSVRLPPVDAEVAVTTAGQVSTSDQPPPVDAEVAVTTAGQVSTSIRLPPVDAEVAAATVEQVRRVDVVEWIDGALVSAESMSEDCARLYSNPLDVELFADIAEFDDAVISELMLNLDASLGAAAEWCRRGNDERRYQEASDAVDTAALLAQRMVEIGL